MLEIILLLLLAITMARKPARRRRRAFNLRPVRTSVVIPMLTTGAQVALTTALTGSADGAYRCMSVKASWRSQELTDADGPLVVGYAHSDYSVTEIKEFIESSAAISVGDKVAQEKSNRLIRIVGTLGDAVDDVLNDGKLISTKLNWLMPIGKAVNAFAYNDGITMTTGALVRINGTMWVKDSS